MRRITRLAVILSGGALTVIVNAQALKAPQHPRQSLVTEGINVTTADFLDAYFDADTERRRFAEAFLIGVLDTTEGVYWCDYSKFKTITITEHLAPALRQLSSETKRQRAASVITEQLKQIFPCKDAK